MKMKLAVGTQMIVWMTLRIILKETRIKKSRVTQRERMVFLNLIRRSLLTCLLWHLLEAVIWMGRE